MIGDIIKEQRIFKDMTRKTLAEGICTEKYIYLIEKNERNPSAYILNNLSDRLGIDLFEYYQYLNYKDKRLVAEYKEKFERYIQLGDIEKLKEESLKAAQLEDFKEEPLSYDMVKDKKELPRYNTVIITVFISMTSLLYNAKEYNKLIKHSNKLIDFQEENGEYNRIHYVYFYISFAYYKTNNLTKSKDYFMRGIHSALLFKNKLDISYILKMEDIIGFFDDICDDISNNRTHSRRVFLC